MLFKSHVIVAFLCFYTSGVVAGPLADTSAYSPESDEQSNTLQTNNKTPDLSTILNTIKGGSDIHTLLSFLQEFKAATEGLQKYMSLSPLMKHMVTEAAKRNVELDVLLKVMNGGMPDLHDIYRLATTKSNNIVTDIHAVMKNDTVWKSFSQLIRSKDVLSSSLQTDVLLYLLTGKKVDIDQSLLERINSKGFTITPTDDVAHVNMLHTLHYIVDNYGSLIVIAAQIGQSNPDYVKLLQAIAKTDMSHLKQVVVPPQDTGSGKFGVGLHRGGQRDPDLVQMLKDLNEAPQAQSEAEPLVLDVLKRFFSITSHSMEWVEAEGNNDPKPNISSGQTVG